MDFYRMAYAPASNADAIRFIFRGVQKVSQKNRPLRKTGAIFRVPFFFELFGFLCNFGYSARKPPKGANCPAVSVAEKQKKFNRTIFE